MGQANMKHTHTAGFSLEKVEKGLCIIALISLVIIAALGAVLRRFSMEIPSSNNLLKSFLLLLCLFGIMLSSKTGDHLSISLSHYIKNEKIKNIIGIITGLFSIIICTILAWASLYFLYNQFVDIDFSNIFVGLLFGISLCMPLAFMVMAIRFGLQMPKKKYLFLALGLILGTIFSFTVFADYADSYLDYEKYQGIIEYNYNFKEWINVIKIPLIILFAAIALAGAPIFTALAGISLVFFLSHNYGIASTVNEKIFNIFTDHLSIIAIPLFTLTGFILSESQAGQRLVRCFRALFGWLPGGLIIVTIILCAFFTSFTGASGVTILALGGILYTILSEKSGYSPKFTVGLLTSAGGIGLLFPPSLPLILTGVATREDVRKLFLGALFPGILLVIVMIALGIYLSKKQKIPREPFRLRNALFSLKDAAMEMLMPVFLILGYVGGFFQLPEIGAISVIYVLISEVLIHKDIKIRDIPKVFLKALPIIGGVLCIIAAANALSAAIIDTQAPGNLAAWLKDVIQSKVVFLLLLNVALLIVGCLMDIFSAILVFLPLVVPLAPIFGIDPVHMGVIFLVNLEVGFLTPPVGLNLFLASYRFEKPFSYVCRSVLPFVAVRFAVVLLVTFIPFLSTYLPGLL